MIVDLQGQRAAGVLLFPEHGAACVVILVGGILPNRAIRIGVAAEGGIAELVIFAVEGSTVCKTGGFSDFIPTALSVLGVLGKLLEGHTAVWIEGCCVIQVAMLIVFIDGPGVVIVICDLGHGNAFARCADGVDHLARKHISGELAGEQHAALFVVFIGVAEFNERIAVRSKGGVSDQVALLVVIAYVCRAIVKGPDLAAADGADCICYLVRALLAQFARGQNAPVLLCAAFPGKGGQRAIHNGFSKAGAGEGQAEKEKERERHKLFHGGSSLKGDIHDRICMVYCIIPQSL